MKKVFVFLCILLRKIPNLKPNQHAKLYIVSLTSYGLRTKNTAPYAIYSLFKQTVLPDKIILWLDKENWSRDNIPSLLKRLECFGLDIRFCEDIKSYKKLIPTIENFPEDHIITVDDDVYYPKNWLEQLLVAHKENPNKIICHRAHGIKVDENHDLVSYNDWDFYIEPSVYFNNSVHQYESLFPTGCGGILYPPKCFHKDIVNKELFMKLAPKADDIWFWAMAVINKEYFESETPYVVVENGYSKELQLIDLEQQQGENALWNYNLQEGNDKFLKAVVERYPQIKFVLEKIHPHRRSDSLKTCTVTFLSVNYGSFLQTYALQQFLGKSNYILNFVKRNNPYSFVGKNGWSRRILPFFWRLISLWRYFKEYYLSKYFDEVYMLNLTNKYSSINKVIKKPPLADIYITGSDQVWNVKATRFCEDFYFLKFGNPDAKRVAYAASMGMKEWPSDFTQQILPHLKTFDAISVREESSALFLKSIGMEKIVVTCDPTLLWNADFYRTNFPMLTNKSSNHIFIYWLHVEIPDLFKKYKKKEKIITVALKTPECKISITQWLHYIDAADSIITNSFHGTVFSILFHKPFVVFSRMTDGQDQDERLISLLKKVNLEYRLLTGCENQEEMEKKLNNTINWEQVDAVLEEWRSYSRNWLMEAIK